ncbi:hypothetical protein [Achromobacter sp. MFA1 R4]|uniref:hypothetical protein n=1 Tax=Achromobacter sp. MFA1 R4 TaxID=1881016 RepID=UPI0009538F0C|nr:hypothetical protein [Achromobacter sp. MFA1 R4]SIT25428.1 hypothetical protein SAMN05428937_3025 [Achromobacter sp. MFA1 R4]
MDHDLPARVSRLEQRVDKYYYWGCGVAAAVVIMSGGYVWYANEGVRRMEKIADMLTTSQIGQATMQVDIAVMKREQERQDRAWKLLSTLLKKGNSDVSSSQERE